MNQKIRRHAALALLLALGAFLVLGRGHAGNLNVTEYVLFNGVNRADSSEVASPWIPIRGASRVYIRTWSAGAAADTDFSDTITTWKTLLSDSVSFMARDSLGTIVTARSSMSSAGAFPMCADSIVITNSAGDSVKMVAVAHPVQGVGKPVRGSVTGRGYYTIVLPIAVGGAIPGTAASAQVASGDQVFMTQYLRIRITPRTRLTTAGFSSTAGLRTRGLNQLRMLAYVVFPNR